MARILVVDDIELILDSISSVLKKAGYEVATACGKKEALEKLQGQKFNLVVTDKDMPEKDKGVELLQEMRQLGMTMPVILLTGRIEDVEGQNPGFHAMLRKPAKIKQELLPAIQRALRETEPE